MWSEVIFGVFFSRLHKPLNKKANVLLIKMLRIALTSLSEYKTYIANRFESTGARHCSAASSYVVFHPALHNGTGQITSSANGSGLTKL